MKFKRLGNIGIALTVALLALNLYLNREGNLQPLGTGPAGFPWPTDGLGRVTVGMEGSFRIELEERIEGETTTQRVPTMTIVGIDPGPDADGMSFRQALVTSLSVDQQPQVIARAPRAWLAVVSDENGTHLDRTRPWRLIEPTVRFPAFTGGQEFVLTTGLALLDPQSNEVRCPGEFKLTSSTMEWTGQDLRLDPATGTIYIGEQDGRMDWKIAGKQKTLNGHTDGGGIFRPIDEETHEIVLHSKQDCWMNLPLSDGSSGRLESNGLRVTLKSEGEDWLPQTLVGVGQTFWTSALHTLSGGPVEGRWNADQKLNGLLVDGPLLAHTFGEGGGWLTGVGGGWIDPESGTVDVWDRVAVNRQEGFVLSQRVAIAADNHLLAEGDPMLLAQHGMMFAQRLQTHGDNYDLIATEVLAYPSSAKIDTMQSPSVVLSHDGQIFSPTGFDMNGQLDGSHWRLHGNKLKASNGKVPILANATGAVEWKLDNGRILGDRVDVMDNGQITARGNPMLATFPVEGGNAIGSASSCSLSEEKLCLTGSPNVDFPAVAMGLMGSRCLVAADIAYRNPDGGWSFLGNVVFSGACSGTAQKAFMHADGRLELFRSRTDQPFEATLRDGQTVIASAGWFLMHPGGKLELKQDLDLTLVDITGQSQRVIGQFGEMSAVSGWVTGNAEIWARDLHAQGNRLWWETDEFGKTMLHLEGHAEFDHPQGRGRAHKLDMDPVSQEIEMHRNARRKAWLSLEDGRVVEADWIRLDPLHMLLSSRQGRVTKAPVDPK
jgi:hypothetical protein